MPYSEIVITAPDSAQAGVTVNFSVKVKNISAYHYTFHTECWAPDQLPESKIIDEEEIITSGSSKTYSGSFVMPSKDAQIFVWVERWAFDHYVYDNSALKDVILSIPGFSEFAVASFSKV